MSNMCGDSCFLGNFGNLPGAAKCSGRNTLRLLFCCPLFMINYLQSQNNACILQHVFIQRGCIFTWMLCGVLYLWNYIYIYIFKMDTPYNCNQIDLQPYCYFRCARLMPLQWHLLKANGQPRMTIYWSCVLYFWNHQHYIFIIYADSFITTDPARRILRSLYRDLDTYKHKLTIPVNVSFYHINQWHWPCPSFRCTLLEKSL